MVEGHHVLRVVALGRLRTAALEGYKMAFTRESELFLGAKARFCGAWAASTLCLQLARKTAFLWNGRKEKDRKDRPMAMCVTLVSSRAMS